MLHIQKILHRKQDERFNRRAIDPDALELPRHMALMIFDEAAEIEAIRVQGSRAIFP